MILRLLNWWGSVWFRWRTGENCHCASNWGPWRIGVNDWQKVRYCRGCGRVEVV